VAPEWKHKFRHRRRLTIIAISAVSALEWQQIASPAASLLLLLLLNE